MLAFRPLLLGLIAGYLVSRLLPRSTKWHRRKGVFESAMGDEKWMYEPAESLMDGHVGLKHGFSHADDIGNPRCFCGGRV